MAPPENILTVSAALPPSPIRSLTAALFVVLLCGWLTDSFTVEGLGRGGFKKGGGGAQAKNE